MVEVISVVFEVISVVVEVISVVVEVISVVVDTKSPNSQLLQAFRNLQLIQFCQFFIIGSLIASELQSKSYTSNHS